MHRLKQSFKHTCSLDRVRKSQSRNSKNEGAATSNQIQRPSKQQASLQPSKAASDRISLVSQPVNQAKERRRLTKEQEVIREGLDGGDGSPVLCRRRPDHGALRQ